MRRQHLKNSQDRELLEDLSAKNKVNVVAEKYAPGENKVIHCLASIIMNVVQEFDGAAISNASFETMLGTYPGRIICIEAKNHNHNVHIWSNCINNTEYTISSFLKNSNILPNIES